MADFIKFDRNGYEQALKRSIREALGAVTGEVYKAALVNLAQLKVRKVDAKYVTSFPAALKFTNKEATSRFVSRLYMDNSTPNQSFRALYYEYGTGINMRPPVGWSPGGYGWNPQRPAQFRAPIYYRDREWTDLGGNVHKGSVKVGVKKKIPRKSIFGHPIRAQFWFRNALKTGTRNLDRLILQAVKNVPITAYIKLRDIRVRM